MICFHCHVPVPKKLRMETTGRCFGIAQEWCVDLLNSISSVLTQKVVSGQSEPTCEQNQTNQPKL